MATDNLSLEIKSAKWLNWFAEETVVLKRLRNSGLICQKSLIFIQHLNKTLLLLLLLLSEN